MVIKYQVQYSRYIPKGSSHYAMEIGEAINYLIITFGTIPN